MSHWSILIADDDADIRETLRDTFADEGYVVYCATNGLEALDILRGFDPPCAVVLDLIMPVMNGNDLYAAMQNDPKLADIPVVISTSDPSRAPVGTLLLRKPIDLCRMVKLVARIRSY